MVRIHITESTTVAQLKKQFNKDVSGYLRVYKNRSEANENDTLVSLGAIEGSMEYRTSRTVGSFEESLMKVFNLKVKVFTPDNWVRVLNGITLETIKSLPRQTNKADMAKYIAYKRSKVKYPKPIQPDGYYIYNPVIEAKLPCSKSVEYYENVRAHLPKYVDQEEALERLFNDLCPINKDLEDILIKCSTLNDFYSTQIYNTYEVGCHYSKFDIDKRIKNRDLKLVNDLALVNTGGKQRNFYSLASKYCSHHRPDVFPIYDSFVDKMLTYFMHRDGFYKFAKKDLKDYPKFVDIINTFRTFYGLEDFSLTQIDTYLWLLGKDAFFSKHHNLLD
ncbi:MAG: hypothetical protein J6X22_01260 [Muribaculaceae bacterium]|nr:hypothetical protein [Muribaculaceae bacterium]